MNGKSSSGAALRNHCGTRIKRVTYVSRLSFQHYGQVGQDPCECRHGSRQHHSRHHHAFNRGFRCEWPHPNSEKMNRLRGSNQPFPFPKGWTPKFDGLNLWLRPYHASPVFQQLPTAAREQKVAAPRANSTLQLLRGFGPLLVVQAARYRSNKPTNSLAPADTSGCLLGNAGYFTTKNSSSVAGKWSHFRVPKLAGWCPVAKVARPEKV